MSTGADNAERDGKSRKPVNPEKEHENPQSHDSDSSVQRQLSEQATNPGDQKALAILRGDPDGQQAVRPKPVLDHDALLKKVEAIHDALYKRALFGYGWSSPDVDRVFRELEPLNQADRGALENLYGQTYPGKEQNYYELRKDLRDMLSADADAHALSILNRQDGRTNDAGQVNSLLTKIDSAAGQKAANNSLRAEHVLSDVLRPDKFLVERYENHVLDGDRSRADKQLRETIAGLNSKQLAELEKDYQKQYGKSFRDALLYDRNISSETRQALGIYLRWADVSRNGIDNRSPQDLVDLANIGLKARNLDMLAEALRGDGPVSALARKEFASAIGAERLKDAFSGEDLIHANDFLKEGRIRLATIVREDTAHWYHSNKADLQQALTNASETERNDFKLGRELVLAHKTPTNMQELAALDYYNDLHKAFAIAASNDRELAIFEDKLLRKGSLVSDLAETQSDGWWITGIGKGHDTGDLLSKIENMRGEDWKRLHDDPTFKRDIASALSTFAAGDEQRRAMDLLDRKANAHNYEESKLVRRSLTSAITDDTRHGWFGSTSHDGEKILDAVAHLSPDEQSKYRNDAAFRQQVDNAVDSSLSDGPEKVLAHRLLSKIASGSELRMDAVDKVLMDDVKGADVKQTACDIESAFKENPDLLDSSKNQSPAMQEIREHLERALTSAAYKSGLPPEYSEAIYDRYAHTLLETGSLPLPMKLELSKDKRDAYAEVVNAPENERARLLNPVSEDDKVFRDQVLGHFSDDERKLLEAGLKQKEFNLADRIRAFTLDDGSNYHDFQEPLAKLRQHPEQLEAIKNEYVKKYSRSLDDDLLSRVDEKDRIAFRDLLTPAKLDGRQDFYDALAEHMKSRTGLGDTIMAAGLWDGSRTDLDRALNQNAAIRGEYARKFQDLPPETQRQLIDMYAQAIQSYRDSKGQMTEQLVDGALVVGSLAAAPLSGGASLTAIAAIAAAGASFKIVATAALEGDDMKKDPKTLAKLALEGAFTTGLAVVGPAQFAAVFKIGDVAAAEAVAGVGTRLAREGLLREGYEIAGQKALATLTREALVSGRDLTAKEFAQVAEGMVKSELTGTARTKAVQQVTSLLAKQYNVALEQGERTLAKTILQGGRQIATETVSNAVVGGLSSAGAQVVSFPLDYDPRLGLAGNFSALADRMEQAGISGAAGGAVFTGIFHVAKPVLGAAKEGFQRLLARQSEAGEKFAVALAIKSGEHFIAPDPANPTVEIRHSNGDVTVVRSGQEYKFLPGDEISGMSRAQMADVASVGTSERGRITSNGSDERLWVPERDLTSMSHEERVAIAGVLRDNLTGLAQNHPIDSFIESALKTTGGWSEDLSRSAEKIATYKEPLDIARMRYQNEVVPDLAGRLSPNELLDRDLVVRELKRMVADGELSQADAAKRLTILKALEQLREPYGDNLKVLNQALEKRRVDLEKMLNQFADSEGLPRTKLQLSDDLGSARASYADGVIRLRKDAIYNTKNTAELLETLYHEFVHQEQDNTIVRMLIDHVEKSTGGKMTAIGADEAARIRKLYKDLTTRELKSGFLEDVFTARGSKELAPGESARARKLVEAFRDNSPPGQEYADSVNHFRMAKRELRSLRSDKNPNAAWLLLERLAADKGGTLSEHLFGSKVPPPEIQKLIDIQKAFLNGGNVDWPRKNATELLGNLLQTRISEINEARKLAYDKYFSGIHEKEAWYVGERVRLRAKDRGATNGEGASSPESLFGADRDAGLLNVNRERESLSSQMANLEGGSDGKFSFDAQERINRLREQAEKIQDFNKRAVKAQSGRTGDALQIDMFYIVRDQLSELQSRGVIGREWEMFPTAIGSGADKVGADYLLVNKKNGEFTLLDPTSNPDKKNVALMRKDGAIQYDARWIDESGALKVDLSEPLDIQEGVRIFQTDLRSRLTRLTGKSHLLNLNEAPFPAVLPPSNPEAVQKGIDRFVEWLKSKSAEYARGSEERHLFDDYVRVLEEGAQRHSQLMAAMQPAPPQLNKTVQKAADMTIIDMAVKKVLGQPFERPLVQAQSELFIDKNGQINLKVSPELVYDGGTASEILNASRSRLVGVDELKMTMPESRFKQLRKRFPGESEQRLLERLRDAIQDSGRLIGTRTSDNYRPFVDDLGARLRSRTTEDLMRTSDPARDAGGALPVNAQPEVQPSTVLLETIATTTRDLKTAWKDIVGDVPLNSSNKGDLPTVMHMLLDDVLAKGTWKPEQVEWYKQLMAGCDNGDAEAVRLVENVLQAH
jgi:hypothetical protein